MKTLTEQACRQNHVSLIPASGRMRRRLRFLVMSNQYVVVGLRTDIRAGRDTCDRTSAVFVR
jgi:hypothetical protein